MSFSADAFGGVEGTTLSTYDAAWQQPTGSPGTAEIASGRARNSGTSAAEYYKADTPPSADYKVSAALYVADTVANRRGGVVARCITSARTFYMARLVTGTGWQLFKIINGTGTQLGSSVAQTVAAGSSYAVELRVNGTTIALYKLGETTPIISVTDTSISVAGYPGIYFNTGSAADNIGIHVDDWAADPLSSSATIAGTQSGVGTQSGDITTAIPTAGVQIGLGSQSGALTTSIPISAVVSGVGSQAGDLLTRIEIGGAQLAAALQSLAIATGISVAGIIAGEGAASGGIVTTIQVGGQQLADSLMEGGIATSVTVAGQQFGAGAQSGDLAGGPSQIAGQQAGAGAQSLILSTSITLTGDQIAEAILTGSLSTEIHIGAVQDGQGVVFGDVATAIEVSGTVGGAGSQTGGVVVGQIYVLMRNPLFLVRSGAKDFRVKGPRADFRVRA